VHSTDGRIEKSLALRFPFSPSTIVKAKRRQCLYRLVYGSKKKTKNKKMKKKRKRRRRRRRKKNRKRKNIEKKMKQRKKNRASHDRLSSILSSHFLLLFCFVIATSNKMEKPETRFFSFCSSVLLALLYICIFSMFLYVTSIYVFFSSLHFHEIDLTDIARF